MSTPAEAAQEAPTPLVEVIAANTRQLRAERGWSQEKLARVMDMSRDTVRSIEKAEGMTVGTLDRLAQAFGVSPGTLATPPYLSGSSSDPPRILYLISSDPAPRRVCSSVDLASDLRHRSRVASQGTYGASSPLGVRDDPSPRPWGRGRS